MTLKITAISTVLALGLAGQAAADRTTIIVPNGGVVHGADTSHGVVVVGNDYRPVVRRTRCEEGPNGNTFCSTRLWQDDDPKRVIILGN